MKLLSLKKKLSLKWLMGLSLAMLFVILAVGLNPRGYYFSNNVSWIAERPGIRFNRYSIAYTQPLADLPGGDGLGRHGFSLEIALQPANERRRGFRFILTFHNGDDSTQFLLGQKRSTIIVMNGDDYAHRKKIKRIAADTASMPPKPRLVTISTGVDGTKFYFDGKLMRSMTDLKLKLPTGGNIRLLLGNSVYGRNSWRGDIYGVAVYNHPLAAREVACHFDRWSNDANFSFLKSEKPCLLYLFNEGSGTKARDHAGGNYHLDIPAGMQILEREILDPPWNTFSLDRSYIRDILLNFAGFIPFGFIMTATMIKLGGNAGKHTVLMTVMFCFLLSLVIELLQAWMPSRSSHLLDLLLNTLGGCTGALVHRLLIWFRARAQ